MPDDGTNQIDRRQFLKTTGTAGLAGLAGCLGGGGGGGSQSLKIGLLAPFSGGYGFYGKAEREGAELAFKLVNESDEILPDTALELVTGDTKTDPETGLSATRDLVLNQNVDHIMGATSTAVANTIRNFVAGQDMTYTIVAASSPFLTNGEDCNRKTFRTHNHSGIFSEGGANWSTKQFGERVYLLYQDYSYGYTVRDNVIKGVEGAGGEIIGQAAKPLGANTYGGVIDEIMDLDPDWVSMNMAGTGGVPFYTQAAQRGLSSTLSGSSVAAPELGKLTPEQFEKLPDIYSDSGVYVPFIDNEANTEFKTAFAEEFDKDVIATNETGYTPAIFVARMLDEAGPDASLDDIIAAGEGLSWDSPKGTITIRECDHQGAHPIYPQKLMSVEGERADLEILTEIDGDQFREPCDEIACKMGS